MSGSRRRFLAVLLTAFLAGFMAALGWPLWLVLLAAPLPCAVLW